MDLAEEPSTVGGGVPLRNQPPSQVARTYVLLDARWGQVERHIHRSTRIYPWIHP